MNGRPIETALWVASVIAVASTGAAWRWGAPRAVPVQNARIAHVDAVVRPAPDSLDAAVRTVIAADPFALGRKERTDGATRTGEDGAGAASAAGSRARTVLHLRGIVGPPWAAILEGVPGGRNAVVARAGDSFGDLRVRVVGSDHAIVEAPDTVWHLTLEDPWN